MNAGINIRLSAVFTPISKTTHDPFCGAFGFEPANHSGFYTSWVLRACCALVKE